MKASDFARAYNGKTLIIPGYASAECVAVFWEFNRLYRAEGYAAAGAANLWDLIWETYDKVATGRYGDFGVWSGTTGAYKNNGSGHTAMLLSDNGNGTGQFLTQNPGATSIRTLSYSGLLGFLRPKYLPAEGGGTATLGKALATPVNRAVTQKGGAFARAAAAPGAALKATVAQGAPLAVIGYVKGTDPYGTGDDAWYLTKSGYYVWANAASNDLRGLPRIR